MRIALLSLRVYLKLDFENFFFSRLFWNEAIAIPPLGLMYLASTLEKDAHLVKIIDGSRYNYSNKEYIKHLKEFKPDVIGISLNSFSFHDFLILARDIKRIINVPIVVGGSHVSLYPREIMRVKSIDFAIHGEGEEPLRELITGIEKKYDIRNIKNLCFREKNGRIVVNEQRDPLELDDFPFPAYNLVNLSDYKFYFDQKTPFVTMFIGRGCPYKCNFCVNKPSIFRLRSVTNVILEIKKYYYDYGIKQIHFYDDCFTFNKKWVLDFTDELKKNHINIRWTCLTRVDCVDDELLGRMASSGCFLIRYGIESGDPRILKLMNKNLHVKKIITAIELTKKNNIACFGFFMIGIPGETKKSVQNTFRLILNSPLDYIRPIRFIAMPKVNFYLDYVAKGYNDFWNDFLNGRTRYLGSTLHDVPFSERQLNKFVKKMYLRFYLNPKRAFSLFKKEKKTISQVWTLFKSLLAILMYFFS